MATWIRRLFSSTYRRALAAEAAGDYGVAAEQYALANMPSKVAEMHLIRAQRAEPAHRLDALQDAVLWLEKSSGEDLAEDFQGRLAETMLAEVRQLPAGDPRRGRLCAEAAQLCEQAGLYKEAGEAFEIIGDKEEATRCYEAGGAIEDMERLLDADSGKREKEQKIREAFDSYETALARGERLDARLALRRCANLAPSRGYGRLVRELEGRMPPEGRVTLRVDGKTIVVIGRMPAVLGRGEADLKLRSAGISRRHVAIDRSEGQFVIRDAGSKNGTKLAGLPLNGQVPLRGDGMIGLGDNCELRFHADESLVTLSVLSGADRGLRAFVTRPPFVIPETPFKIDFIEGWASVQSATEGPLLLDGGRTPSLITVLTGDVVEHPSGGRLEVSSS